MRRASRLPVDALGAGPKLFQRVVLTSFVVEQVNHKVAVVLENPSAGGVAFHADDFLVELILEGVFDFVGDGVQLPAAGAGNQQEEIENRGHFAEIEQGDFLAAIVVGDLRGSQRNLQTALRSRLGRGKAGSGSRQRILFQFGRDKAGKVFEGRTTNSIVRLQAVQSSRKRPGKR